MVLCRGLHYYTPLGNGDTDEAALGCSAHTDYGLISLLHQTAKGLQVLHAEENAARYGHEWDINGIYIYIYI